MDKEFTKPILLIFFNRPDTFSRVFEVVRKIRPSKLYLAQDGARPGKGDEKKVLECRKIADSVDWNCEVKKNYAEANLGCGTRPYSAISWVLNQEEDVIILEDDCVADISFFAYCEELLDRYRDDERILYISGLNHFEKWDFGGSSYGFTKGGAIWGWATWRRSWANYDYCVSEIADPYLTNLLAQAPEPARSRIDLWKNTNSAVQANDKLSYWDVQWGFVKYTQNQLVIVPKYNLIQNIGIGVDSTHGAGVAEKHTKYKDYNNMPTKPLEFPLKHPSHMMCDTEYDEFINRCNRKITQRVLVHATINKLLFFKKNKRWNGYADNR